MQRLFVLFAVCLLSAAALNAATIYVPGDSATIQAGIDGASSGDTVLVTDGTYTGDGNRYLTFTGKNIVLMSQNGPSVTIIDCGGSPSEQHMGFHLHTGVDSTAVIDGFTITKAYDTSSYGAVIVLDQASPTIRNCVITGNHCSGILSSTWSGRPRIENCTITYNAGYAGIDLEFGAVYISGSVIAFNDGFGAFLYTHPASLTEVSHSVFRGNNGYAGLLVTQSMSWYNVLVFNCTFVDNNIGFYADWIWPKVDPTGLQPDTPYVGSVNNNVFAFNRKEGIDWFAHPDEFDYDVYCNNSFGNDAGDWPDTTRGPGDPYGNLARDPLFCDTAAGDFHIAVESPCAPANNSCAVLMGAFGTACTCCENRGNVDRLTGPGGPVDVADLTYLISYLFQGGPEPPCPEEGNVDSGLGPGGPIDVGDVTYLVAYLFQGGPAPPPCP